MYRLQYSGPAGVPSGVTMAGVQTPKRWQDLVAWVATIDLTTASEPPDWIPPGPSVNDEGGSGTATSLVGSIPAATVGPVCLSGTWPALAFVPGTPFEVAERP